MAERLPTSSSSGRRRREGDASIGDFVIGGEIGKGSFAQVYSGYHKVRKLISHAKLREPLARSMLLLLFASELHPFPWLVWLLGVALTKCQLSVVHR